MKRKKRNILLSILIGAFLLCAIAGGTFYYYLFAPQFHPSKTVSIIKYKNSGMSISPPDSSGWQNIKISIRISIPDVMPFAPMTMSITYIVAFPEAIRKRSTLP